MIRLILVAGFVLSLLACGAGEDNSGQSAESAGRTADPPGDTQQVVEDLVKPFIPAADQFGVERFKVVFEMEGQQTGLKTMWVEDYGGRVALAFDVVAYRMPDQRHLYWNGDRIFIKTMPDGEVSASGMRPVDTEPTSFATTSASDLETVGYERLGDKTVAGITCEHWKNAALNYEGCRWKNIELEFLNGAGTQRILQRATAVEFVEGESIPAEFKAMDNAG